MNKLMLGPIASIAIFATIPSASAQDDLIDYLVTQCEADIETHCGDVAIGENRVLSCLAEHDAELTENCKTGLANSRSAN
jgi:hypothetical protein